MQQKKKEVELIFQSFTIQTAKFHFKHNSSLSIIMKHVKYHYGPVTNFNFKLLASKTHYQIHVIHMQIQQVIKIGRAHV